MLTYIVRRIALGLLTIWAVSVLAVVIIQLPPGDFVTAYIAKLEVQGSAVSQAEANALRAQYGLDETFVLQYAKWIFQVAQGNFGVSLDYARPVGDVIGDRLALTMVVTVAAILFTWMIALPIGIYSAVRQYSIGTTSSGSSGSSGPRSPLSCWPWC